MATRIKKKKYVPPAVTQYNPTAEDLDRAIAETKTVHQKLLDMPPAAPAVTQAAAPAVPDSTWLDEGFAPGGQMWGDYDRAQAESKLAKAEQFGREHAFEPGIVYRGPAVSQTPLEAFETAENIMRGRSSPEQMAKSREAFENRYGEARPYDEILSKYEEALPPEIRQKRVDEALGIAKSKAETERFKDPEYAKRQREMEDLKALQPIINALPQDDPMRGQLARDIIRKYRNSASNALPTEEEADEYSHREAAKALVESGTASLIGLDPEGEDVISDIAGDRGVPGWFGGAAEEIASKATGLLQRIENAMAGRTEAEKKALIGRISAHSKWGLFVDKIQQWASQKSSSEHFNPIIERLEQLGFKVNSISRFNESSVPGTAPMVLPADPNDVSLPGIY